MKKEVTAATVQKKKTPIIVYILLYMFTLYVAFMIAEAWDPKLNIIDQTNNIMNNVSFNLFSWNWNRVMNNRSILLRSFLILAIFLSLVLLYTLSQRDFITGKEYGVADWGSIEKINKKYAAKKNEHENRIYSNQLRISMNGRFTRINNNAIVVGGSGAGKSMFLLRPNLYQASVTSKYPGSFVITDPDGSLLRANGKLLKKKGYLVKSVNLISGMMQESDRFNPMLYLRNETDVLKFCEALFANTRKAGENSHQDPFFDNQAKTLLQSVVLLVWLEHDRYGWKNDFNQVMDLVEMADVEEGNSPLDEIMLRLAHDTLHERNGGTQHPAYKAYKKATKGANDTVLSIIATLNEHIRVLDNPDVRRIFSGDDLDLKTVGTGEINGRKNVKTALFLVIPDADTTFNCIAGMIYTMLIQELYFQADFVYRGELPVPVTFWFDEFANIALPENFPKVLATMRKRLMSAVIIIQNMAQIKGIYKEDGWENIVGNCDVFIYLGGNEPSTFKYISENLGKKTVWKRSHGASHGGNSGSSSTNDDVLGRELMLPDEVRELDTDYCIVLVRGQKPVLDLKYQTFDSSDYKLSISLGEYMNSQERNKGAFTIETFPAAYGSPNMIQLDPEQPMVNLHPDLAELFRIVEFNKEQDTKEKKINIAGMSVVELLSHPAFHLTNDELYEVTEGIANGLTDEEIKSYILCGSAEVMKQQRLLLCAIKMRQQAQQSHI
uniref:VirD4-like conjugal transfer protein, CD1115 family n=1 Tax=Coprococcus sp. TaxID=2049024 RepID=UPI003FEEC21E